MCFRLAFILQRRGFAFDLFNFLATGLTWYGREVDDGRDHRTQANKDPKSDEHDAPGGSGLVSRDSRRATRSVRAWKSKPSREGTDCPVL